MTAGAQTWVADGALVCLDADAPRGLGTRIDTLLSAGAVTFDDLLPVLTEGGLANVPRFLCVLREDDGVRIVVRGASRATVSCRDGGERVVDGTDARTWREELIPHATAVRVALAGVELSWFTVRGAAAPAGTENSPVGLPAASETDPEDLTLAEPDVPWPVDDETPSSVEDDPAGPADEVPYVQGPTQSLSARSAAEDFDFSNLLDETRFRDVESAAVRPSPPTDEPDAAERAEPAPSAGAQRAGETEGLSPARPHLPESGVLAPRPAGSAPLISVVPGLGGAPSPQRTKEPGAADAPGRAPADDADGNDAGHTISIGELRRQRAQTTGGAPPAGEVQALRCPAGHDSPPTAVRCRICDTEIVDRSVHLVTRPVVARLRFSTGAVVDLDKGQLVGRKPTVDVSSRSEPPGLVTVPSPDGSISRVHVAVHVEGWDVLVEDQGSTNGTVVVLPGKKPERLREHDPRLVVPGSEIRIADTVTFSVEVPRP